MTAEADRDRPPATPAVLVTAHGLSNAAREQLARAGKRVLDTTCPLVRRAHDAALAFAAEGRFVVVVGRPGHVEVEGLTGDLPRFAVVPGPEAARPLPDRRLGVLFQTTTPPDLADRVLAAIRRANPDADLAVASTICRPTRDRQAAVDRLLGLVEALVVVGGRHSNNTRALVARAVARGVPAHHVRDAADLRPEAFADVETVGLTAGTSTLPETIDEVHRALAALRIPARAR
jgi:4-hydroxy-3-methylbut-2-enyl diphosphate reductase